MSLNRAPFRRVLYRPVSFLGGERELTMLTAIICGGLAWMSMNAVAIILSAVAWLVMLAIFRQMFKFDPQLSKVYLRQRRYRGYYPARSHPCVGDDMSITAQVMIAIGGVCLCVAVLWWVLI